MQGAAYFHWQLESATRTHRQAAQKVYGEVMLECHITTCKLGFGETVWKTPSLPAFAADVVVVLERDIATFKLVPEETI